ncbi:hypothetical protein DAPPUDRAFT_266294 [Daphnia pulex]|uniref:Uncharacterized protein n=1 Tax=Daphnia pulex TaxID=6669 RepID=E9HUT8_DAPPU|nr:hypothetical protein DAPPUDRAFT_266294 [Daphnia pulex]|eukprot:EFX64482.1 hypothetical protein DAPPUDRAFT_266294 [Daphnia pulex]
MEKLCAIFERLSLSEKRKRTLEYNDEETSTKKLLHRTHVKTNGPPSIAERVRMEKINHQTGRTGINPHTHQPDHGNLLKNNLVVNSSDRGRIVYFGSKQR